MPVAQNFLDPEVALEHLNVVPHQHERLLLRVEAHEIRLGEALLEVMADREALGEARAVVELEHRDRAARILSKELRLVLLARAQVDLTVGTSMPFSAMNSRTLRGLGALR